MIASRSRAKLRHSQEAVERLSVEAQKERDFLYKYEPEPFL
jgi:hypothetical protein